MRAVLVVFTVVWTSACTNDYGAFRFPKAQVATQMDAGDAGVADAG